MAIDVGTPTSTPTAPQRPVVAVLPGLVVVLVIAALALVLGRALPIVGAPVFAMLLGVGVAACAPVPATGVLAAGSRLAATRLLQASIVVLGTGLSVGQVVEVGAGSVPVMIGSLAVALIGAVVVGKWLGVARDTRMLIGVGTGICGASAIAAATSVTKPKDADVGYALGTIFVFNIAAVLTFPAVGHLIGMSGHEFGLWSGTAVNDMSSVVAAAQSYGSGAQDYAVVVKLVRSLMIIPICLGLAFLVRRRETAASAQVPWNKVIPGFLIGFVVAAAINSMGIIPVGWHSGLSTLATFLITAALAGIGLSIRLKQFREAGVRPLALGGILWVLVAGASLGLQAVTGA